MLFKKDYFELDSQEMKLIQKAEDYKSKYKDLMSAKRLFRYFKLMPDCGNHYLSLFPNNYLYSNHTKHGETIISLVDKFKVLINSANTEREILNFISENECYFILESILKNYLTGHHGSFLFKEFCLSTNYKVDYLIVGKRSGGFDFIFVEFEHPLKEITTKDGDWGAAFRKGFKQIEDWDAWIDSNYSSLRTEFKKFLNPQHVLPAEFYELDKSRIHYLVIAGRRSDFSNETYRRSRKLPKNIKAMHYDNLLDSIEYYLKWEKIN